MVKLLFCGDVGGNWKLLSDRLDDLQNSQHGPFDALFLTGRCFSSEEELSTLSTKVAFPIKTYCFDAPSYATKYELPSNMEIVGMGNRCGIVTLQHNLTVAYQMGKAGEEGSNGNANLDLVKQITASVGYRGCDICITSEWPKEMHHFLEPAELTEFKSTNIGIGAGSKAAASFAMLTRPRYHFVSGMGVFYQRSPYRNPVVNNGAVLGSNASTRLLAVCHVSATKEKTKKWLHALSVRPIIHLSAAELSEAPAGTTDCPYADVGVAAPLPPQPFASSSDGSFRNPFVSGATSLPSDEQAAKRARIDGPGGAGGFVPPPPAGPPPATGSFFFGNMGVPRGPAGAKQVNLTAPSDAACTLFIGGLMRSMQDSDLESALQGVRFIRRPPGKAFAFVEFVSHEAAKNVVDQAARRGLNVQGRTLTVGWAKGKEEDGRAGGENDRAAAQEPQLVPPSEDAKTLFIAGLTAFDASPDAVQPEGTDEHPLKIALDKLFPGVVSVNKPAGKSYAFVEFENYDAAMAVVTKSIQEPRSLTLQGTALVIGWAKGDGASGESRSRLVLDPPSATSQVLFVGNIPADATEEQISGLFPGCNITAVKRPQGREYAFVEFTTPADAQQAMSLSAGGEMQMGEHVLLVGWAKGRAAEKSDQSSECWFCLASAVVKVHLIVSVGEHSYLALPRGAVTPKHVLICPVECVPSRVHLSAAAKAEIIRFQDSVEQMFRKDGAVSLRFERALRTKGSRDHMQAHMIPLSLSAAQLGKSFSIFLQKASLHKLKFHEVQDEQSIDEVVVSMEGGPYQEYFYIEIPVSAGTPSITSSSSGEGAGEGGDGAVVEGGAGRVEKPRHRRFVYVQEEGVRKFPMQFGLEVAAEMLGQPERGHWKHCLLPEEEEARLCDQFRQDLAPFDFTLSS